MYIVVEIISMVVYIEFFHFIFRYFPSIYEESVAGNA